MTSWEITNRRFDSPNLFPFCITFRDFWMMNICILLEGFCKTYLTSLFLNGKSIDIDKKG